MAVALKIQRIDDRSIFEIFRKAKEIGEATLLDIADELSGENHKIQLSFSTGLPWGVSEEELEKCAAGQFALASVNLNFSATTNQGRGQSQESINFALTRGGDDSLVDSFRIANNSASHAMNGDGEQRVQKAIHERLSTLLRPVAPEDGGLVPTLSNLSESFSQSYQKISEELSASITAVNEERAAQMKEFQSERLRLQHEASEERSSLLSSARDEIESQRLEMKLERAKLDEEWSKLEVSSHKDARRQQFAKIQEDLNAAMSAPVADRDLRRTRWAVFLALIIAGGVAAYFAYLGISNQPTLGNDTAGWLLPAIRTMVLSFASLASFLGAAAWMRYFYSRDMQAQEELRRFRNDMARASWIMDATMEIRTEHKEDIPEEWIVGVTEGLFTAQKRDSLEEGAQALAALMGLSASAKFGPSGTSVELSKKGGKAISAAMKEMG